MTEQREGNRPLDKEIGAYGMVRFLRRMTQ